VVKLREHVKSCRERSNLAPIAPFSTVKIIELAREGLTSCSTDVPALG
jgi:hypothetical protein